MKNINNTSSSDNRSGSSNSNSNSNSNSSGTGKKESRIYSIIAANQVPGIDEIVDSKKKLEIDVSHRPDAPSIDDFETIPIGDFGMALMKGMGFNPNDNSNSNSNNDSFNSSRKVKFLFSGNNNNNNNNNGRSAPRPRPKGLGLGAKLDLTILENKDPKKYQKYKDKLLQMGEFIETEEEKQAKIEQHKQLQREKKKT